MTNEKNIIITRFLEKYTSIDFFKEIINIFLYPAEFNKTIGHNDQDSFPSYVNSFFSDLNKKLKQYNHEKKQIANQFIETSRTILQLRNAGQGLITYSTIDQHYSASNAIIKKLIQDVKNEKIEDDDTFRQKINTIILFIQYFFDFQIAIGGLTKIQEYQQMLEKSETSPIEAVEKFKEMTLQLDNDLSALSTNHKDEVTTDYYILSDKKSVNQISELITDYLCSNYSFYNTGLLAYDESVNGFESSSVHIIASPSNGGKSITLSNLLYRIAKLNNSEFSENDAALYITCEDDSIKTTRKFMSIFGNYEFEQIRQIYKVVYEFISQIKKDQKEIDNESKKLIKNIFNDILYESITKTTLGNLKIIFKYAPENTLSAGELQTQIKKFQTQGINIKYLIIDYLDVLKPTLSYGNNSIITDEYYSLGVITQELRTLSRNFGIPVITATQTSKIGDNVGRALTNDMIGESYKKVKFSDFIYMQRMRDDLDIFSQDVEKHIFHNSKFTNESPYLIQERDKLITTLKPLEMRVSKSKEKGKGYNRYILFSSRNLRLYNTIDEYFDDLNELEKNNSIIMKKIEKIKQLTSINSSIIREELINTETPNILFDDELPNESSSFNSWDNNYL